MKWQSSHTLIQKRLVISTRENQRTFYARCLDEKPNRVTPLNTRDQQEARSRAARLYFKNDSFRLGFAWQLFQEEHQSLTRLPTIRRHITNMIIPRMGDDVLLDDLEEAAKKYIKKRRAEGKADSTIDAELSSLGRVLRWSKKIGLAESIITLKIHRLDPTTSAPPSKINSYKVDLHLRSFRGLPKSLKAYATDKSIKPHHRYQRNMMMYAALLSVSTGAPPRVIRSLRNWCISFNDQDECRVVIGLDGKAKTEITASFFGDTKRPARWMKQWQKMQRYHAKSDYLFASSTGGDTKNAIPEAFQRFIKATGYEPISFLNLRHAYLQSNDHTSAKYGQIVIGQESDSPRYIINGRKAHSYIAPAYDNPEAPPHIRFNDDSSVAWQKRIQTERYDADLKALGITKRKASLFKPKDFKCMFVPSSDKEECKNISLFIERHEYLGVMPTFVTQRFGFYLDRSGYPSALCGVMIFSTPYAQSSKLGGQNEKLISRGATISFAPKMLASRMVMKSIDYMVKNTSFTHFTAYADPSANEIGTIYQACGFKYLGQDSGVKFEYMNPDKPELGWQSDRSFTERSSYVRYAKRLKIQMKPEYYRKVGNQRRIDWRSIPDDIASQLKNESRADKAKCIKRKALPKHKYVHVKAKSRRETRELRDALDAKYPVVPYPKR